jgi:hypothetical protein
VDCGVTYWVGEAMGDKDYKDFAKAPKAVAEWTPMLASNAAHIARLLKNKKYPGIKGGADVAILGAHLKSPVSELPLRQTVG